MSREQSLDVSVTIITPTLNRANVLLDAIESIDCKKDSKFEHIVVDGGSVDNTLEVVARYPWIELIGGKDRGVYDAFNKGVKRARGEIIGFLNSDDVYEPGALKEIAGIFMRHEDVHMVSGGAVVENREGRPRVRYTFNKKDNTGLSIKTATFGFPIINARFFRRQVFDRIGDFDIELPLLSDREFLIRAALEGLINYELEKVVYRYRAHGGSLTYGGRGKVLGSIGRERMRIGSAYLDRSTLTGGDRRLLEKWHSDGAVVEIANMLKSARVSNIIQVFGEARRYNRRWWRDMTGSFIRKMIPETARMQLLGYR